MSKYFFGCGEKFCGDFYTFHCDNLAQAYKTLEVKYHPTSQRITVALKWDETKNRFVDVYESSLVDIVHAVHVGLENCHER
jgi:hypothetical protein